MTLLDGKTLSQKILNSLKPQVPVGDSIRLDIILVGDNPSSQKYVTQKQKVAQDLGIACQVHRFPSSANTVTVLNKIHLLNRDPASTAIIVQLPLPSQLNAVSIINAIDSQKDVDGLSAANLGLLFQNSPKAIASATPRGIIELLSAYSIPLVGKNAVIIGRSSVVGLPLLALLKNADATVTLCHSKTQNLASICASADILISATNHPGLVTPDFVKQDAVVIDVGYPAGDVDFNAVSPKTSFITPVPGGIGPMTIASLFQNLLDIYQRKQKNARNKPRKKRRN